MERIEIVFMGINHGKMYVITIGKQSIIYSQRMKMTKHALGSTHVWFTKLVSVWIRVSYNSCDSGMARGGSKPNQSKLGNGGKVSYKLVRIRKFWILLLCVNSFIYKGDVLYFISFKEIIIQFPHSLISLILSLSLSVFYSLFFASFPSRIVHSI